MLNKNERWKLIIIVIICIICGSIWLNNYKTNVLPQKVYEELSN